MLKSGRDTYLRLFRYYYTLKYLGLLNIYRRILFNYRRKFLTVVDVTRISSIAERLKQNQTKQKEIAFSFFGKNHKYNLSEMLWQNEKDCSELGKHWLDKLNSFEWLNEKSYPRVSTEIASYIILHWISLNLNEHSESWAPHVLAKRITYWVKWSNSREISPEVNSILKSSICLQLKRLYIDFELHSPSNHLLENIRGFLAGCTQIVCSSQFNNEFEFQLEETAKLAISQIQKQFLADGAYFERVPMCHAKMLELLSDIRNFSLELAGRNFLLPTLISSLQKLAKICQKRIILGQSWLEKMTHSDGYIAQFGDSARIVGMKHSFDEKTELLESSGYFVHHKGKDSFILRCGEPAPAFQPGHNHCDILSFELVLKNSRCIVDTGCSDFDNETLRQMSRETEAHNLPMVQHQEQSDIWGTYSMGKRAFILERSFNRDANSLVISIEDQFGQRLRREVNLSSDKIEINDILKNRRMTGTFVTLIHLEPETKVDVYLGQNDLTIAKCETKEGIKFYVTTEGNIRIDDYLQFFEIGKTAGGKVLIISNKESEVLSYSISW